MAEKKEHKKPSSKDLVQDSEKQDSEKNKQNEKEESVIPDEILEQLPEEERGRVTSIIRQTMIAGVLGRKNPIADKITSDHIDKILDGSEKNSEREYNEKKNQRWFIFAIILVGIALLIFLTVYLAKDNEATFMKILIPILAFLGGMGAGYGVAKKSE